MISTGFVKENYRVMMNRATSVEEAVRIASSPAPKVDGKLRNLDVTSTRNDSSSKDFL
jgi:hypothetical protein